MRFIISINKHWVMTTHASVCTYAHYIQQVFLYFNIDLTSTFSNTMANHAYYSSFTFINMSILQSKNSSCFTKKLWTLTENCGLLFIPLLKKHKILTYESILDIQNRTHPRNHLIKSLGQMSVFKDVFTSEDHHSLNVFFWQLRSSPVPVPSFMLQGIYDRLFFCWGLSIIFSLPWTKESPSQCSTRP